MQAPGLQIWGFRAKQVNFMFLQSGVIPYRYQDGAVELLLVRSSIGKHWGIPKGWISPWMTSAQSAAKEAWEDAGVVGNIRIPAVGYYQI